MPTFKTEAIVLAKRQIWEADRLYILYTKDFGKIEAQVKSAVKTTSKLAGSLEPVSLAEVMVIRGRSRETIGGVQLKKRYQFNKSSSLKQVGLIRELFIKLIKPEVKEEQLYSNLKKFLEIQETMASEITKKFLTQRFIWQMLEILGHGPDKKQNGNKLLQACSGAKPSGLQISDNLLQELEKFTGNYLKNILEK